MDFGIRIRGDYRRISLLCDNKVGSVIIKLVLRGKQGGIRNRTISTMMIYY